MSIVMKEGDDGKQFELMTPQSNVSAGCLTFDIITIPCGCDDCDVHGHIDVFAAGGSRSFQHILREKLNKKYQWNTIEASMNPGIYSIILEYNLEIVTSDSMFLLANISFSSNNCTNPGGQ